MKTCKMGGDTLPLSDFNKSTADPTGYQHSCRKCNSWYRKERTYGLNKEKWMALYNSQSGKCKICGCGVEVYGRATATDHDHETGEVRGILCNVCNSALGKLGDNEEGLLHALKYVRGEL